MNYVPSALKIHLIFAERWINNEFTKKMQSLEGKPYVKNPKLYQKFTKRYGTHVSTHLAVGAMVKINMAMDKWFYTEGLSETMAEQEAEKYSLYFLRRAGLKVQRDTETSAIFQRNLRKVVSW